MTQQDLDVSKSQTGTGSLKTLCLHSTNQVIGPSTQWPIPKFSAGHFSLYSGHMDAPESMWNKSSTWQRKRAGRVVRMTKAAPLLFRTCGWMWANWKPLSKAATHAYTHRYKETALSCPDHWAFHWPWKRGGTGTLHAKAGPTAWGGLRKLTSLHSGDTETLRKAWNACL